jgi:CSLREA domain-containing protein
MLSFADPKIRSRKSKMQNFHRRLSITSLLFLSFCIATDARAQSTFQISIGPLFTVNSTADTIDANPGDGICADSNGRCTLRAAIEESNQEPIPNATSTNVIIFALPNPAVIDLTLGELNITSGIWIFGPGARRLTVQRSFAPGTANFRVFRVASNGPGVEIRRMTIRNGNAGSQDGGGILAEADSGLSLSDVAIVSNSAANGGGIAVAARAFFVNRILVNSNTATLKGGGIFNQGFFSPKITNSTITNNTAASGGAIHNTGSLLLANDTISNNTATVAATSIFSESGSINILNTIIGRDAPSAIAALSGSFTSSGNNVVTDSRNSTGFTNGVNNDQVSENNVIDPLLGGLVNNGGHTDTRALLTGSPAIDAGNDCVLTDSCSTFPRNGLSSDQRGRYQRKVGNAVDVGAFEAGAVPNENVISFGLVPRPGGPAFFSGAIGVLTSATTNEKNYSAANPVGAIRFQNIAADFYILEIRGKRALYSGGPFPIGLDEIPIGAPTAQFTTTEDLSGFRFTIDQSKSGSRQ